MESNEGMPARQHAYSDPAVGKVPEPSSAERVRTLLTRCSIATLSTLSQKHIGLPFGSLMPFALDGHGRPIFLISNMAMHTHNLKADSRCSLFVTQIETHEDPLGAPRVTLIGNATSVSTHEVRAAREAYLPRHPNSRYWVDFSDFAFFKMELIDLYFVGGFGVMGWVSAEDYRNSDPDPLANASQSILDHMNADHEDALTLLANAHTGLNATRATMTSVDRLGFTVRVDTAEGIKGRRINFLREVANSEDTRKVLVEMVRQAKAK